MNRTDEKFKNVPRDGKHFTPEELMEEALKDAASNIVRKPASLDRNWSKYIAFSGGQVSIEIVDPFTGYRETKNIKMTYGNLHNATVNDACNISPMYQIDIDLIQSIEDIKNVLRLFSGKEMMFYSRDEVRGIEHLVKKL
jgi:hypothetical protein